ncbi:hypothetical protein GOP47_0005953 [Adiantum capillus-veneris]|uniref:Uncharacterized protein n=1 Tax=Adiantum capillus-veneris TaxID=13818 RepID=A0A9D4V3H8_ADICA|nr:hypothetical protein GOP47_0005953 [Adiantum capillus-veneris]
MPHTPLDAALAASFVTTRCLPTPSRSAHRFLLTLQPLLHLLTRHPVTPLATPILLHIGLQPATLGLSQPANPCCFICRAPKTATIGCHLFPSNCSASTTVMATSSVMQPPRGSSPQLLASANPPTRVASPVVPQKPPPLAAASSPPTAARPPL